MKVIVVKGNSGHMRIIPVDSTDEQIQKVKDEIHLSLGRNGCTERVAIQHYEYEVEPVNMDRE